MTAAHLTKKISIHPDAMGSLVDNDVIAILCPNNTLVQLSGVGSKIWQLLEATPMTLAEICNHIQQHYDVMPEKCVKDVLKFITGLLEKNILAF